MSGEFSGAGDRPARRLIRRLLPAASGAGMLLLWEAAHAALSPERRFLLPSPLAVAQAFVDTRGELGPATLHTAECALIGLLAAVVLSSGFALLLALSPLVRACLYPYLMILQMTPIIVLAPVLILWVGAGFGSVVVVTFLVCLFPLVVNTTQGLISADRNLVELFRMYRASRTQELLLLRIPSALPYFFSGLRIAATLAPIGAIAGDIYAGNSTGGWGGIGFLTILYGAQFQMAALFAAVVVSCLLGCALVGGAAVLGWLALRRWHDSYGDS